MEGENPVIPVESSVSQYQLVSVPQLPLLPAHAISKHEIGIIGSSIRISDDRSVPLFVMEFCRLNTWPDPRSQAFASRSLLNTATTLRWLSWL